MKAIVKNGLKQLGSSIAFNAGQLVDVVHASNQPDNSNKWFISLPEHAEAIKNGCERSMLVSSEDLTFLSEDSEVPLTPEEEKFIGDLLFALDEIHQDNPSDRNDTHRAFNTIYYNMPSRLSREDFARLTKAVLTKLKP